MTGQPALPCWFPPPPLENGQRTQHLPSAPAPSVLWTPCVGLSPEDTELPTEASPYETGARPPSMRSFWAHEALCPYLLQLGVVQTTGPLIVPGWEGQGGQGWTLGMKPSRAPQTKEMHLRIFTRQGA